MKKIVITLHNGDKFEFHYPKYREPGEGQDQGGFWFFDLSDSVRAITYKFFGVRYDQICGIDFKDI